MKEAQINQIPEVAHNQAMLTIQAGRQELIRSREHIQNLEKALEEGRVLNEQLLKDLELSRANQEIIAKQRDLAEEGQKVAESLFEEAQKRIEDFDLSQSPDRESEALTRYEMKTICAPVDETGQ